MIESNPLTPTIIKNWKSNKYKLYSKNSNFITYYKSKTSFVRVFQKNSGMKEEKKFFDPKIYPKDHDLAKEWFVYYYIPVNNGTSHKRIKVSDGINRLKTVEERIKYAENLILKIKDGSYSKKYNSKSNGSVLSKALNLKRNSRNKKTISAYENHLDIYLKFLKSIGKHELNVKKIDAEEFKIYLINIGLSGKTIKNYLSSIKALYNKHIDVNEIYNFRNPFQNLENITVASKSKMWFNDFQIEKVKNYLIRSKQYDLWLACQLQYYCFIRPNELRQLKASHFNLNAGYIEITSDISKNNKTQKVSIPNSFYQNLEFIDKMKPNQYIFPSKRMGKCIGRNTFTKKHNKALKTVGINGNYSLYSWKHTGVVKSVKNGIYIKDLQLQLRHSSLDMVNEYLKDLGILDLDRIKDVFPGI